MSLFSRRCGVWSSASQYGLEAGEADKLEHWYCAGCQERIKKEEKKKKKKAKKKNKAKQAKFDGKRRNDSDDDEYGADAVPKRRKLTLSIGKKR